jgi:hypothetical protein
MTVTAETIEQLDFTPPGLKTAESSARVKQTMRDLEDAILALANAATQFLDSHEDDLLYCMEMYEGVADEVRQLRSLIVERRKAQDLFLRAAAGE